MKNRQLINFEKKNFDTQIEKAQSALPMIQKFIDAASKHDIELMTENFAEAARKPVEFAKLEFMKDLQEAEPQTVGRLTRSKEKSMEGFEMPNISEFVEAANTLNQRLRFDLNSVLVMIVNGKAKMNPDEVKKVEEACSSFIHADESKQLWDSLTNISRVINDHNNLVKEMGSHPTGISQLSFPEFFAPVIVDGKEVVGPNVANFWKQVQQFEKK